MDKEYERVQFGVDSKKLHFKTNGGKLSEVKFKIHFPEKFEFLNAEFTEKEKIEIYFKGIAGSTVNENWSSSIKEETQNITVDLSNVTGIPKVMGIEYILSAVKAKTEEGFVPETAGGGILVGTGG
ncbi:hypothetical protein [Christiangramia echinicola]|uniref:hypothetical protein n=1 Tax=Christiangramia echinicola TaxID=279359 RepID=UPI0003FD405B|nr:hypothetical protein [Christiangramia echinicola]